MNKLIAREGRARSAYWTVFLDNKNFILYNGCGSWSISADSMLAGDHLKSTGLYSAYFKTRREALRHLKLSLNLL